MTISQKNPFECSPRRYTHGKASEGSRNTRFQHRSFKPKRAVLQQQQQKEKPVGSSASRSPNQLVSPPAAAAPTAVTASTLATAAGAEGTPKTSFKRQQDLPHPSVQTPVLPPPPVGRRPLYGEDADEGNRSTSWATSASIVSYLSTLQRVYRFSHRHVPSQRAAVWAALAYLRDTLPSLVIQRSSKRNEANHPCQHDSEEGQRMDWDVPLAISVLRSASLFCFPLGLLPVLHDAIDALLEQSASSGVGGSLLGNPKEVAMLAFTAQNILLREGRQQEMADELLASHLSGEGAERLEWNMATALDQMQDGKSWPVLLCASAADTAPHTPADTAESKLRQLYVERLLPAVCESLLSFLRERASLSVSSRSSSFQPIDREVVDWFSSVLSMLQRASTDHPKLSVVSLVPAEAAPLATTSSSVHLDREWCLVFQGGPYKSRALPRLPLRWLVTGLEEMLAGMEYYFNLRRSRERIELTQESSSSNAFFTGTSATSRFSSRRSSKKEAKSHPPAASPSAPTCEPSDSEGGSAGGDHATGSSTGTGVQNINSEILFQMLHFCIHPASLRMFFIVDSGSPAEGHDASQEETILRRTSDQDEVKKVWERLEEVVVRALSLSFQSIEWMRTRHLCSLASIYAKLLKPMSEKEEEEGKENRGEKKMESTELLLFLSKLRSGVLGGSGISKLPFLHPAKILPLLCRRAEHICIFFSSTDVTSWSRSMQMILSEWRRALYSSSLGPSLLYDVVEQQCLGCIEQLLHGFCQLSRFFYQFPAVVAVPKSSIPSCFEPPAVVAAAREKEESRGGYLFLPCRLPNYFMKAAGQASAASHSTLSLEEIMSLQRSLTALFPSPPDIWARTLLLLHQEAAFGATCEGEDGGCGIYRGIRSMLLNALLDFPCYCFQFGLKEGRRRMATHVWQNCTPWLTVSGKTEAALSLLPLGCSSVFEKKVESKGEELARDTRQSLERICTMGVIEVEAESSSDLVSSVHFMWVERFLQVGPSPAYAAAGSSEHRAQWIESFYVVVDRLVRAARGTKDRLDLRQQMEERCIENACHSWFSFLCGTVEDIVVRQRIAQDSTQPKSGALQDEAYTAQWWSHLESLLGSSVSLRWLLSALSVLSRWSVCQQMMLPDLLAAAERKGKSWPTQKEEKEAENEEGDRESSLHFSAYTHRLCVGLLKSYVSSNAHSATALSSRPPGSLTGICATVEEKNLLSLLNLITRVLALEQELCMASSSSHAATSAWMTSPLWIKHADFEAVLANGLAEACENAFSSPASSTSAAGRFFFSAPLRFSLTESETVQFYASRCALPAWCFHSTKSLVCCPSSAVLLSSFGLWMELPMRVLFNAPSPTLDPAAAASSVATMSRREDEMSSGWGEEAGAGAASSSFLSYGRFPCAWVSEGTPGGTGWELMPSLLKSWSLAWTLLCTKPLVRPQTDLGSSSELDNGHDERVAMRGGEGISSTERMHRLQALMESLLSTSCTARTAFSSSSPSKEDDSVIKSTDVYRSLRAALDSSQKAHGDDLSVVMAGKEKDEQIQLYFGALMEVLLLVRRTQSDLLLRFSDLPSSWIEEQAQQWVERVEALVRACVRCFAHYVSSFEGRNCFTGAAIYSPTALESASFLLSGLSQLHLETHSPASSRPHRELSPMYLVSLLVRPYFHSMSNATTGVLWGRHGGGRGKQDDSVWTAGSAAAALQTGRRVLVNPPSAALLQHASLLDGSLLPLICHTQSYRPVSGGKITLSGRKGGGRREVIHVVGKEGRKGTGEEEDGAAPGTIGFSITPLDCLLLAFISSFHPGEGSMATPPTAEAIDDVEPASEEAPLDEGEESEGVCGPSDASLPNWLSPTILQEVGPSIHRALTKRSSIAAEGMKQSHRCSAVAAMREAEKKRRIYRSLVKLLSQRFNVWNASMITVGLLSLAVDTAALLPKSQFTSLLNRLNQLLVMTLSALLVAPYTNQFRVPVLCDGSRGTSLALDRTFALWLPEKVLQRQKSSPSHVSPDTREHGRDADLLELLAYISLDTWRVFLAGAPPITSFWHLKKRHALAAKAESRRLQALSQTSTFAHHRVSHDRGDPRFSSASSPPRMKLMDAAFVRLFTQYNSGFCALVLRTPSQVLRIRETLGPFQFLQLALEVLRKYVDLTMAYESDPSDHAALQQSALFEALIGGDHRSFRDFIGPPTWHRLSCPPEGEILLDELHGVGLWYTLALEQLASLVYRKKERSTETCQTMAGSTAREPNTTLVFRTAEEQQQELRVLVVEQRAAQHSLDVRRDALRFHSLSSSPSSTEKIKVILETQTLIELMRVLEVIYYGCSEAAEAYLAQEDVEAKEGQGVSASRSTAFLLQLLQLAVNAGKIDDKWFVATDVCSVTQYWPSESALQRREEEGLAAVEGNESPWADRSLVVAHAQMRDLLSMVRQQKRIVERALWNAFLSTDFLPSYTAAEQSERDTLAAERRSLEVGLRASIEVLSFADVVDFLLLVAREAPSTGRARESYVTLSVLFDVCTEHLPFLTATLIVECVRVGLALLAQLTAEDALLDVTNDSLVQRSDHSTAAAAAVLNKEVRRFVSAVPVLCANDPERFELHELVFLMRFLLFPPQRDTVGTDTWSSPWSSLHESKALVSAPTLRLLADQLIVSHGTEESKRYETFEAFRSSLTSPQRLVCQDKEETAETTARLPLKQELAALSYQLLVRLHPMVSSAVHASSTFSEYFQPPSSLEGEALTPERGSAAANAWDQAGLEEPYSPLWLFLRLLAVAEVVLRME